MPTSPRTTDSPPADPAGSDRTAPGPPAPDPPAAGAGPAAADAPSPAELAHPHPDRNAGPSRQHALPVRIVMGFVLALIVLLLTVVIVTPIALSSQDLIGWAAAPTGLNLAPPWPVLVFIALDAGAGVCVLFTVYCAWRGEPAGAFGLLVWCFAAGSAFANWRHGTTPSAAPDAIWFFPAMSLAGPALLEAVLGRIRRWFQRGTGRRRRATPAFGWRRWTPGLGSFRDTYGAYRTALLLDLDTVDAAITTYHQLCPDGNLKVVTALRAAHNVAALPPGRRPEPAADSDRLAPDPPASNPGRELPVELMRRIPVNTEAYQRWRDAWTELHTNGTSHDGEAPAEMDLNAVADRHGYTRRQIEHIRRAGQAGLLNSPIPPAVRLATLATDEPDPPEVHSANGHSETDASAPALPGNAQV